MSIYRSIKEKSVPARSVQRKTAVPKQSSDQEAGRLSRLMNKNAIQAKLKIGKANDRYEREADRVADRVMASPDSSAVATPVAGGITPLTMQRAEEEEAQAKPLLQRQEEEEGAAQPKLLQKQEEEEEAQPKLQRQPEEEEEEEAVQPQRLQRQEEEEKMVQAKGEGARVAPAQLPQQLNAVRGGGRPLPESERTFFEPRFGVDFSGVRVHEGGQASQMARSVQAKAFTVGQDVVFGAGQYAPESKRGRKLLAHELTHVVQQESGRSSRLQRFNEVSSVSGRSKSEPS